MKHFTYTTATSDYGLNYETIETLHVETIGYLTSTTSAKGSDTEYSGNDPDSNAGALLEAINFIIKAKRNSKTLKIDSTVQSNGVTIAKGTINMQRFIW